MLAVVTDVGEQERAVVDAPLRGQHQDLPPGERIITVEDTAELRLPGDHVVRLRVLLAPPGADELPLPTWNENEFLLAYGRRPTIRTFTPRRTDPHAGELDVEIVVHDGGAASDWAEAAAPAARRPSRA